MSSGLNVKIEEEQDKTILRVEGRLDAASSPNLENKLNELIKAGKKRLLLDFTKVDYLSSAGMRLLLSVTKKLKSIDGKLNFCSVNEEVMEIIKMAGFERILAIYLTEKDALEGF
jgi:anti-anti-sigma factor